MQPLKFVHKPLYVEAIEVTDDNMIEVAKWCGGEIHSYQPKVGEARNYIKVPVKNALNERQTQAFAGDSVLKVGGTFKAFTAKAFAKSFNPIAEEPCGRTDTTADGQPCVIGRGHRAFKIGCACRSLQDYLVLTMTQEALAEKVEVEVLITV